MSDQEDTGQLAVRRAGMEHKGDFKPAANLLTQLARGWAAGTAGLPGDLEGLARLAQKYTTLNQAVRALDTTPVLPTSEFYKEWLPGEDKGVGGKEMNNIGSLFGGAGSTTLARGGIKAGKGALTLADTAARNAAVPRTLSTQAGVIKAPGGNWLSGSVEDALKGLKKQGYTRDDAIASRSARLKGLGLAEKHGPGMNAYGEPLSDADLMREMANPMIPANMQPGLLTGEHAAINNWIDKQLTKYVKNDMATERDPVRALAERGVLHVDPEAQYWSNNFVHPSGEHLEKLAKNPTAQRWENVTDNMLRVEPASTYQNFGSSNLGEEWINKLDPNTPFYRPKDNTVGVNLGFDHLIDELRNATNPASGLPRELLLDPKSLDRLSVPQAVERVARINQWRAAQKIEANQALANNAATVLHKEYPHSDAMPNPKGLRWVELKQPESIDPAVFANDVRIKKSLGDDPVVRGKRLALEDALKYEGDTMGHCVGGYCDDVAEGRSRILSLRDAKGQPHVTVETRPGSYGGYPSVEAFRDALIAKGKDAPQENLDELVRTGAFDPSIVQIKGKANLAPNAEYLPFVQDLVRGGLGGDLTNWERVGDLSNAGMVNLNPMSDLGEAMARKGLKIPRFITQDEMTRLLDEHGRTTLPSAPKSDYASGGSVPNNPYTIDAAAFHTAVDPLLGDAGSWQAHDDSPQKLALQLGNGATWNVGGGEGTYGSGVYKYDPITEADDKRYQEALAAYNATGLATFNPDNIAVGSGLMSDRANMLESWLGSGVLGSLRAGAQGFDVGDAGHVEGHAPTYEDWTAAIAKAAPGYDPNKPIYRVRGDMSQLLGKPDSRMFLDAGYQEIDGRMVPLGTPSRTYQKSVGAENISMLSALLAPYAVGTALTNAAAGGGSAMAQAATEANAANAAQGFGQLGVSGAAPAAGIGEQAIAAYQAAQPYLKAANTVGALARGNPMGALGGYLPGVDLGLGDFGNTVANGAVKAGLSGGNPLLGAVAGAAGEVIPAELRQYLPMAQGLVAATEGKLSLTQALNMLARYNSSSSKGA